MCCDLCPSYHECAVNNTLKKKCCDICPDYDMCSKNSGEEEDYDKSGDPEMEEDN